MSAFHCAKTLFFRFWLDCAVIVLPVTVKLSSFKLLYYDIHNCDNVMSLHLTTNYILLRK